MKLMPLCFARNVRSKCEHLQHHPRRKDLSKLSCSRSAPAAMTSKKLQGHFVAPVFQEAASDQRRKLHSLFRTLAWAKNSFLRKVRLYFLFPRVTSALLVARTENPIFRTKVGPDRL